MAPHQAELPLADAMNVDVPVPLGARNSFPPQTHSGRGRRFSRCRDWYRERGSLHQREARSQNADTMSAFTSFFRAEAEARPSPWAPNPFVTRAPPPPTTQAPAMTAAQLIAAVVEEEARHPTIVQPPPLAPVIDPGPDVSEIVDAAERLDLERAARESEFSDTDFFGSVNSHHLKNQADSHHLKNQADSLHLKKQVPR
ncbi:hypothetical protein C8R48DRAFT_672521 [Suillus tomentosus]|nr:hypothetical protein C8R48DRAFT_672521 [Suillus tomentosus]